MSSYQEAIKKEISMSDSFKQVTTRTNKL